MNLRNIANRATQRINPNLNVQYYAYAGYTVDAAGLSTPTWAAPIPAIMQIQALSAKEIQHLEAMNLSGETRAAYVNQQLNPVDRASQTGGDMLVFQGQLWQVTALFEGWDGPQVNWSKAALTKQLIVPGKFGF
jgi:hypothetical protein